ncbi:hypothetical protein GQ457_03G032220 [Hibiscus cannabinus]
MACVSWNARGLGTHKTIRALNNLMYKYKPKIVFLSETKQKMKKLEKLRKKCKFENSFYVDPVESAGGLALWWDNDVQISILYSDKNVIDSSISITSEAPWFCSFIYGPPYREEKRDFWEKMSSLRENSNNPWCIMGDSNIVLNQEDKFGGNLYDLAQANWGAFTWTNLRADDDAIMERLDRIVVNSVWLNFFSKAVGISEPAIEKAFLEFHNLSETTNNVAGSNTPQHPAWTPPPTNWVKINCSISVDKFSGSTGAAAMLRNSHGCIIDGISKNDVFSSLDASSIRMGVESARNLGIRNIIIESNNKDLMKRLQSKLFSSWSSAAVEKDIIDRISVFNSCSFCFVPSSCNLAAKWVARMSRTNSCPVNWVCHNPPELQLLL